MTNKQSSDLMDFIEQAKENSLDSLDFAQMVFTIEEVVDDNPGYSHPLLGELNGYLVVNYPDQHREFMKDLNGPAKEAMTRCWYNRLLEREAYEVGVGYGKV